MKSLMRSAAIILLIMLCLSTAIGRAEADGLSGTYGENLTWSVDGEGVLTISGTGAIPGGDACGPWGTEIKEAVIEPGVTGIGNAAFLECYWLNKVSFPESVESIAEDAFADGHTMSAVVDIGSYAFDWCSSRAWKCTVRESAVWPESAHPYADRSDVTWTYQHPSSVPALQITFSADSELDDGYDYVYVTDEVGHEQKFTGSELKSKTVTVSGSRFELRLTSNAVTTQYGFAITDISAMSQEDYEATAKFTITSAGLIKSYSGVVADLVIPDTINGVKVKGIRANAFKGETRLRSVVIPEGVTSVGDTAFSSCKNLVSVTLPQSLTSIGVQSFLYCSKLESVVIPSGVTAVSGGAFSGCTSLKSVSLPDGLLSIGSGAFSGCAALTDAAIPSGVTSIGSSAFFGCSSLTEMTIPSGVTVIQKDTFKNCTALKSLSLSPNTTEVNEAAFTGCKSLTGLELPAALTAIGKNAFSGCTALTIDRIPDGVTSIGEGAFMNCAALTGAVIPDGVTALSAQVFSGCAALTEVKLPRGLTSIGNQAFSDCRSLKDLELPSGLTSVGSSAFTGCTSLTYMTLPAGITDIPLRLFSGCSGLIGVTIPDGVTAVGISAFQNCTSLKRVILPDSVLSVGYEGFKNCTSLERVRLSAQMTYINDRIFENCSSLTSVVIPQQVTEMGERVFQGCTSLKSLTVPSIARNFGQWGEAIEAVETLIVTGTSQPSFSAFLFPSLKTIYCRSSIYSWARRYNSKATVNSYSAAVEKLLFAQPEYWVAAGGQVNVTFSFSPTGPGVIDYQYDAEETCLDVITADKYRGIGRLLIEGHAPGDEVVSIFDTAFALSASCTVHVCEPVSAIEIEPVPEELVIGDEMQITAHVTSGDQIFVNRLVSFRTTGADALIVSDSGWVTAVAEGEAMLVVEADNGVSASIPVRVRGPIRSELPAGLLILESEALMDTATEHLVLPAGLLTIGSRAFANCPSLTIIEIPDSVSSIPEDAFEGCPLQIIVAPIDSAGFEFAMNHGILWYEQY